MGEAVLLVGRQQRRLRGRLDNDVTGSGSSSALLQAAAQVCVRVCCIGVDESWQLNVDRQVGLQLERESMGRVWLGGAMLAACGQALLAHQVISQLRVHAAASCSM